MSPQLESVEAALKADPDNVELQALILELKEIIALTNSVLEEQNGARRPSPPKYTPTPHLRESGTPTTPVDNSGSTVSSSATYSVGDSVLARWTSGDNQLYPARITSVMGSQKNPVYIVKFTQYPETVTLHPKDIKPSGSASRKRKLEDMPTALSGNNTPIATNGAIISQPAAINTELAEARKEAKKNDDAQPKKKGRTIAKKKELEEGQKKWQDFANKGYKGRSGAKKRIGETSMFRTPDSVTGRGTITLLIFQNPIRCFIMVP